MAETEIMQRGYRITGRVQGVCFRVWTQELATGLGLVGTVRNRPDGSVEAHARGEAKVVKEFETRLWDGPPAARVEGVEPLESADTLPDAFRIVY
jgi:acylphosphatase